MVRRAVAVVCAAVLLSAASYAMLITRYPIRYIDSVRQYASGLEPALVCAVIHAESKFRPNALSSKGASGLMQLTEDTAHWIAHEMKLDGYDGRQIFDPPVNIAIGCYFLNWLLDYYGGDLTLALCAYNAGLGNVNRWLTDKRYSDNGITLTHIPFPETDTFVKRVYANQRIYSFLLIFA